MNRRFIKVLQKDIVTKPEQWKDAEPGKYIKLSNKAKNVYAVLSVIAFSYAGNAEDKIGNGKGKLGKGWFWTSHAILQQLTGMGQKTVQRAIKELYTEGFIDYNPARKIDHQCFFKIKRLDYNNIQEDYQSSRVRPKTDQAKKHSKPKSADSKKYKPSGKKVEEDSVTVKLDDLYDEGVLFQKGIDRDKSSLAGIDYEHAAELFLLQGEEAFLKFVASSDIENDLIPKYKEKLAQLTEELKT